MEVYCIAPREAMQLIMHGETVYLFSGDCYSLVLLFPVSSILCRFPSLDRVELQYVLLLCALCFFADLNYVRGISANLSAGM